MVFVLAMRIGIRARRFLFRKPTSPDMMLLRDGV